jgi:lysophospholipase L1-like esterase
MSMRSSVLGTVFFALALSACGGGTGEQNTGGSGGAGGGGGAGGATSSSSSSSTSTSSSSSSSSTTGGAGVVYKTFVVVGDSISDQGNPGQPGQKPFYYVLLEQNDDTAYPTFHGKDVTTLYGSGINIVKVSKGGATSTELVTQVHGLPASLPGPVLVVGTIGGNDVQAALPLIVLGQQAQADAKRAQYKMNLATAFAELTMPGRFGAGVDVHVLLTNIYDPSDGTGDFTYAPASKSCPFPLGLFPKNMMTGPLIQPWEDDMAAEAAKVSGVEILDLHGFYMGHGVNKADPDNWFHDDCIHPNTTGHEHIRELFWSKIETL